LECGGSTPLFDSRHTWRWTFQYGFGVSLSAARNKMNHKSIRSRRVSAWISMLAILLIYAPVTTATLMAVTGACCTGDQCPIHGNLHPAKESPAQQRDNSPMDCDHHGHAANKMQTCSMSCCHTVEQPAIHAHIFLLTPVSLQSSLVLVSSASFVPTTIEVSPAFAPLAPPPKSLAN
jgi:hypothetical protein